MTEKQTTDRAAQVFTESYESIAATLQEHPDTWYLIGTGPAARLGVFSQTAYRIRRNKIAAFAQGAWETRVSSAKADGSARKPGEEIQVFARFRRGRGSS